MFGYYLRLAIRSLRRNVVLTVLMIVAIGVGIGASMTTLTVFRAMSGDPLPGKSAQLFVPQIDNWGPRKGGGQSAARGSKLQNQLTYTDASRLMEALDAADFEDAAGDADALHAEAAGGWVTLAPRRLGGAVGPPVIRCRWRRWWASSCSRRAQARARAR